MSTIIQVKDLNLWYGAHHALHGVNIDIPEHEITALIGPSGCGKSTFLKTLNRMNDLVPGIRIEGEVNYAGQNIYAPNVDTTWLRKQIGMVFQKANPFPMSIYDNVAYGPRTHGHLGRGEGPAEEECPGPLRRPAAAAVHCPCLGSGAGDPADG